MHGLSMRYVIWLAQRTQRTQRRFVDGRASMHVCQCDLSLSRTEDAEGIEAITGETQPTTSLLRAKYRRSLLRLYEISTAGIIRAE